MTFTQTFGGTTIYPAGVSYRAVALSADQTLSWPVETATNGNVVAQIMDVTPSVGSLSIIMPPANEVSVGETTLFFNPGAFSFTVKDNGGNTIVAIAPGLSYQVYLIGNSTVNGTWRSTQYAAGTSVATAGSLVGSGIKAISTTLNQSMSVTTLNSNYAIGDADRSEAFVWNGGAGAFTLPSSGTVGNDWFCQLRNSGTGAITLTPTGAELINGAANLTFNPGDSAIVICDGSAFFTIGFGQSAAFAFDYVSIDLSSPVTSPYTLSGANLNRIAYSLGGTLTTNMEVLIPATIQQYWISNDTSGAFTLTVKVAGQTGVVIPQGSRGIYYCNGTDIIDADTASFAFPLTVAQGGTGATTESGARINLGGTSVGIGVFTAVTAADGRVALIAAKSGANSDITSLTGLTTPLSVPQGGTGVATLTANGVLYGSGASALAATAVGTTGQVLVGNTGAAPTWSTLSGIGVTSFSAGSTGLTPSTATTGVVTLAGTLGVGNGGTGTATAFTAGSVVFAGASGVYTQNNANFFWDNTNARLGIGTASPAYKLQVASAGAGASEIVASNTLGGERIHLISRNSAGISYAQSQNSQLLVGTFDNYALQFMVNNTTRMIVDTSGNVGIGTSSPGTKLDVRGIAQFLSGSAGSFNFIDVGRTSSEARVAVAATSGDFITGTAAGDAVFYNPTASKAWFGVAGAGAAIFITNSTERMRIDSSGNVGIGTSSPTVKLDVAGGVNNTGAFRSISGTVDAIFGAAQFASGVVGIGSVSNHPITFNTNLTENMRIDTSGNVGIGTASPSTFGKLATVTGSGSTALYAGTTTQGVFVRSDNATRIVQFMSSGSLTGGFSFSNGATDNLTIDVSGNVGIGTSSPASKLEVTGDITQTWAASMDRFVGSKFSTTYELGLHFLEANRETRIVSKAADSSGLVSIYTGVTPTERMRIDSSGNVGIGTSSLTARFTVNGGTGTSQTRFEVNTTEVQEVATNAAAAAYANRLTDAAQHVWKISSTEAMRINASANVGIGTSSPSARITIGDNGTGQNFTNAASGNFNLGLLAGVGSADAYVYQRANAPLIIGTNNTERMRIDSSGNVMVGGTTALQSAKLTAYGSVAAQNGGVDGTFANAFVGVYSTKSNEHNAIQTSVSSTGTNSGFRFKASDGGGASTTTTVLDLTRTQTIFYTGGSERARITSGGDVLVGTTTNSPNPGVVLGPSGAIVIGNSAQASGWTFLGFSRSGTSIGSITQSGTTAVLYNTTSDSRLKKNIANADNASSLIDALQVRKFDWKSDDSHQRYGFVAQELVEVAPEAVHQPEDPDEMMAVDYSKLVPMLVKEIQSLRARVAQLEGN